MVQVGLVTASEALEWPSRPEVTLPGLQPGRAGPRLSIVWGGGWRAEGPQQSRAGGVFCKNGGRWKVLATHLGAERTGLLVSSSLYFDLIFQF